MSYRDPYRDFPSDSSEDSENCNSDSDSQLLNCSNDFAYKNKLKMTTPVVPALRKEFLDMVPEFHGDTQLLPRFIEICEKLVTKFYNTVDINDFQNEYLMSSILSKIKGDAAVNISSCIISRWSDLKSALLNTYSDKRDIYTLNIEIVNLKQGNESPFNYYNKVQHLLNLQISHLKAHGNENEIFKLVVYFRNLALRVFLRGLREPLGSLMRTKNPPDLNSALNMLTNDFQTNIELLNSPRGRFGSRNNFFENKNVHNKPLQITNYAHNTQPKTNFSPHNEQRPSTSQSNNPNFNKTTNVFKSNPNHSFPKPTPMSTSTRNTFRANQNFSNHNYNPNYFRQNYGNSNRNYIAEELHNLGEQPLVEHPDDVDEGTFLDKVASENIKDKTSNC